MQVDGNFAAPEEQNGTMADINGSGYHSKAIPKENGGVASPSKLSENRLDDENGEFAGHDDTSSDDDQNDELGTQWRCVELNQLQQQVDKGEKRRLKTLYGWGTVNKLRKNEDGTMTVLVDLPFGKGYLNTQTIGEPHRFSKGEKVQTPYGKGVVRSLRLTDEVKIYKVKLNEWYMANRTNPTAFLSHQDVKGRVAITFDEGIHEAGNLKQQGNDKFKAGEYEDATQYYARAIQTVQMAPMSNLNEEQKNSLRHILITSFSNRAQACLQMDPPRYEDALRACNLALQIDSSNKVGSKSKILFRRAKSLYGIRQYKEALQDLKDESLLNYKPARELRQIVAAEFKKEKQKGKKMWGAAFEKAAQENTQNGETIDNTTSNSPTKSSAGNPLARSSSPQWDKISGGQRDQQHTSSTSQKEESVQWPGDEDDEADQLEVPSEEKQSSSNGLFSNKLLWGGLAIGGVATAAYIWNRRRR